MSTSHTVNNYYIHPILKEYFLDEVYKDLRLDNDRVIIIEGDEGTGKSSFAFSLAKYIDPNFCLDNVVFTPEQFIDNFNNSDKYRAIVWDEAVTGLYSMDFMSKTQGKLIKMFTTARKKNLFLIIVIANIDMLAKYMGNHRVKNLFQVYKRQGRYRGFFSAYNTNQARECFRHVKRYGHHKMIKPFFRGDFHKDVSVKNNLFFDSEEYEAKKDEAINMIATGGSADVWKDRARLLGALLKDAKITQKDISKVWGVSREYVGQFLRGEV